MIYSLPPFTIDLAAGVVFEPLYEVPPPVGKTAGVSGDGRLHLLGGSADGGFVSGEIFAVRLQYRTPQSVLVSEWELLFRAQSATAGTCLFTCSTEPAMIVQAPAVMAATTTGRTQTSGASGFTWLPAGTIVGLSVNSQAGCRLTVNALMVEDYGQLAPGQEFGPLSGELPVFLFPTATG